MLDQGKCITRDDSLRLPPVPKNQQAKYHKWTPAERRWLAEANRKALALVERLFDAVEGLTGARDPDWWRLALETGRSTGLYLSADDFANLPISDCAAIMRAAADMKAEQRTDVLKVIREAATYGPKPGSRAARMLIALHAANADHPSTAVSTLRLVAAIGSYTTPGSLKTVVRELRRKGLIDTAKGRVGGCWLTTLGRRFAEHLTVNGT